jgi:hypothetical protein
LPPDAREAVARFAARRLPAHRSPHHLRKEHTMRYSRRFAALSTVLGLALAIPGPVASQTKQPKGAPSTAPPGSSKSAAPGGNTPAAPSRAAAKKKRNPREIKIMLMDGSVVLGELSIDTIEVKTEFGSLTVPVEKVLSLTPGLDSHRDLSSKIDRLIRELGDDDYKKREAAHKELLGMGRPVKDILAAHRNDKNAERKRRITEIVARLDEMNSNDSFSGDDSAGAKTWMRDDRVETPNFTIVGDVNPSVFEVRSKYGPLKIGLNDIRRTEKTGLEKGPTLKQISIAGSDFHLVRPKSSGVRVKAGDSVSVAASGTITMPPWGSSARSGPDGAANYGSYTFGGQRVGYGGLVGRIGDSGTWIRIGSRAKFTARKSGVLKFGIVMRSTYTRGNYVFPGSYKVRIKVDPKD